MFKFRLADIEKKEGYNNGQHAQAVADFTLMGKDRAADSVKFNEGSDIPELKVSVKAERFTLALNVNGDTVAEQIADYLDRVQSTGWIYVSKNGYGYGMNKAEFAEFLKIGCRSSLTETSGRHSQPIQKVVRGSEESTTGKNSKFFASYNPAEVTIAEAVAIFKTF